MKEVETSFTCVFYLFFLFCLFLLIVNLVLTESVHRHMQQYEVEYLQFAFRWMNNLLMRELPLRCTIRLWDTYQVHRHTQSKDIVFDHSWLRCAGTSSCCDIKKGQIMIFQYLEILTKTKQLVRLQKHGTQNWRCSNLWDLFHESIREGAPCHSNKVETVWDVSHASLPSGKPRCTAVFN